MLPDPGTPLGLLGSDEIPLLAGGGRLKRFSSSIGFGSCGRASGDVSSFFPHAVTWPSRARVTKTDLRCISRFGAALTDQSSDCW